MLKYCPSIREENVTFDKSIFVNWLGSGEHPQSGPDLIKKVLSDLKITKKISKVEKINTASGGGEMPRNSSLELF